MKNRSDLVLFLQRKEA